ncbi:MULTISPECIES: hypothetical protein [Cyanophyceae]|jgi:hypothetical protein|uniref:hypothetical protein n=1 Tax=Cyanophyceae TaxID=3028117 RepID=UPI00232D7C60|nr:MULTISPECIES: hypothetical protein [Cyanophyceae]MDB9355337.1 hypothetical protein [Nodularia spumigena CS-587/03]MDB9319550.1 hypothetical protein [Nodularia spumigena CS-590/01A]MDB9326895.1 hypothetical protein [Nodularia spumigena CS-590/02]MDB9338642.1 hypothetical protein [Nodularia spumigena CS-589/07]MDB9349615.1 hypothetical protein [Nodularia spumigena CS-588/01]
MNNKHNLEINDLIDNAVNNALERRNEALESLSDLSDEEIKNVSGGRIIIFGMWFPRVTTGMIAPPNDTSIA